MSTYYIAGPMSGIPKFNFPAFFEAANHLRDEGWSIVSPAELDSPETREAALASVDGAPQDTEHTWGDFLARDVKIVADTVTGIILLPGWENSKGARLECYVALECGHHFRQYRGTTGYPSLVPNDAIMSILNERHG